MINKIICGDAILELKKLPDNSIDCIVTSPPYWAVRDYGKKNQIGLEDHPQEYIDKIVEIMKECKRVIKPTGTIWLNLGDSFYTKSGSGQGNNFLEKHKELDGGKGRLKKAHKETRGKFKSNWLQSKQKLLIPYRIAIKCQDELGLILRNDIKWVKQWVNWKNKESKGSSMPTSVRDRLNTNSESIFLFVKNKNYYFNLNAVRIPHKNNSIIRMKYNWNGHREPMSSYQGLQPEKMCHAKGKNPGDCLMFPLEPSREKHYAMFPKTLPDFCIKAGCPKNGIVLDPFLGTGTTGIVAKKENKDFIGIDLNNNFVKIADKRINKESSYEKNKN